MMVVSPVRTDERLSLRAHNLCEVIKSIGTEFYGQTCLAFLEKSLNAEHWALFRFRSGSPLKCVATGSVHHQAAALENIDRFVVRCHSVDPSVKAASKHNLSPTLTKLDINDIEDPQYRHCFELTRVRERVSLFSWIGNDLYQLSAFRGPRMNRFTHAEMNYFAALAELLLVTAQKHEILLNQQRGVPRHLDVQGHRAAFEDAIAVIEHARVRGLRPRSSRQDDRRHVAGFGYQENERHHLSAARLPKARHFTDQRAGGALE